MAELKEGMVGGALNLYFIYKFLRILTIPFAKSDAFKLGIVDEKGKILKKHNKLKTSEEKEAYTMMHRLVWKLKRLMEKVPFGKSRLASYAAALWLIKEEKSFHGTDEELQESFLTFLETDWKNNALILKEKYEGDMDKKTFSNLRKEGINIKKASMKDVIKDFKTSDAPQFKGKSDKKKKEMAIAAKLSKEEVEVDEATSDTTDMYALMVKGLKAMPGSPKQKDIIKQINVIRKRMGMPLMKEDAELDEASKLPPHLAKFFDKKGNLKPEVAARVAKGKEKLNWIDVTPKGYGPKEGVKEVYELGTDEYKNHGKSMTPGQEGVEIDEKWAVGVVYHQDFGGGEVSYFRADSLLKNRRWKGMGVDEYGGKQKKPRNITADEKTPGWEITPKNEIPKALKEEVEVAEADKEALKRALAISKWKRAGGKVDKQPDNIEKWWGQLSPEDQKRAATIAQYKKEKKQKKEEVEMDEKHGKPHPKTKMNFKLKQFKHMKPKKKKKEHGSYSRYSDTSKGFSFGKSKGTSFGVGYNHNELDGTEIKEKKSATGYELYHKDFSSAMQHAYDHAKSKGFVVDPKEIDDKVATGPKKPSSGKVNRYSLKAGRKKVEIQVTNLDNKRYELNMYIEGVELTEALKPLDKAVVDAFYYKKEKEGKVVSTDGDSLWKNGLGGQEIAIWNGRKIKITAVSDVKSTESIIKYMKKSIPSGLLEAQHFSQWTKEDKKIEEGENMSVEIDEAKGTAYPATIDTLRKIVKDKQNQVVMFKSGQARVDLFTASAMVQVYDALKPKTKKKFEDMIKDKAGFMKSQAFAMKMMEDTRWRDDIKEMSEFFEREISGPISSFTDYLAEGRPRIVDKDAPRAGDKEKELLLKAQKKKYKPEDVINFARKHRVKIDPDTLEGQSDGGWQIDVLPHRDGIKLAYDYKNNEMIIKGWKPDKKKIRAHINKYEQGDSSYEDLVWRAKDGWRVTLTGFEAAFDLMGEEFKLTEEAPANKTGVNVVGTGDDPTVWVKKKKRKNAKVKYEDFGGTRVYVVSSDRWHSSRLGKNRYSRYEKYVGNDKLGEAIRLYGRENPNSPIILKNEENGAMLYLKYGGSKRQW